MSSPVRHWTKSISDSTKGNTCTLIIIVIYDKLNTRAILSINTFVFYSLPLPRTPALPLQLSIQNGDKTLGKDPLTSDDSAVTDLSPKTDSSPITETPTKTDASSKTDVGPSTPGGSPQPKKGCCSISKPQRRCLTS